MVLYRLAAKDDTGTLRGLVPYAYDPTIDEKWPPDEKDMLHDPEWGNEVSTFWTWRGVMNVGMLVLVIAVLLYLFIFYPILTFVRNNARNLAIDWNIRINATGQAPILRVLLPLPLSLL
jgi:beta-glucan synthesis-associated protein KRE6